MKLEKLLKKYSPVYPAPYTWDETLRFISSNPSDRKVLDDLVGILKTKGEFRKPIVLGTAEFVDGVEVKAIVNGTHRLCAYIVAGFDEVANVVHDWELPVVDDYSYCLVTDIHFAHDVDEKVMDSLYDTLRSFYVRDDLWLVSDVSSQSRDHINLMWDYEGDGNPKDIRDINAKIRQILKGVNLNDKVISLKTCFEDLDY